MPGDQFKGQVNTLEFSIVIDVGGGNFNESMLLAFGGPHIVDQSEATWDVLALTSKVYETQRNGKRSQISLIKY